MSSKILKTCDEIKKKSRVLILAGMYQGVVTWLFLRNYIPVKPNEGEKVKMEMCNFTLPYRSIVNSNCNYATNQ